MAKGFKHGAGGLPLNFKVVGNPQPTSPKENTIWLDTDEPISGYDFSAKQPESTEPGMVWIATGASSPNEFNAVKKNGLNVYPLAANQYIGGAWVKKDAMIYLGGEWRPFRQTIYSYGAETFPISYGVSYSSYTTVTKNADSFQVVHKATESGSSRVNGAYFEIDEKIDFTPYTTMKMKVTASSTSVATFRMYATTGRYANETHASQAIASFMGVTLETTNEDTVLSLDVSGVNQEAYPIVALIAKNPGVKVTQYLKEWWLE